VGAGGWRDAQCLRKEGKKGKREGGGGKRKGCSTPISPPFLFYVPRIFAKPTTEWISARKRKKEEEENEKKGETAILLYSLLFFRIILGDRPERNAGLDLDRRKKGEREKGGEKRVEMTTSALFSSFLFRFLRILSVGGMVPG